MKELSQELYVDMRRFLIEHPLLSSLDRKEFLLSHENDSNCREIIGDAYEPLPADSYVCPNCGWTLSLISQQPICCHRDCERRYFTSREEIKSIGLQYEYRLKKQIYQTFGLWEERTLIVSCWDGGRSLISPFRRPLGFPDGLPLLLSCQSFGNRSPEDVYLHQTYGCGFRGSWGPMLASHAAAIDSPPYVSPKIL